MKKHICMLIGAVMSVGVIASAADPVYSVNVVGFNRITIPSNGMAIIGIPLNSMTGNQTLEGMLGTNQLRAAAAFPNADKVLIWDRATTNYLQLALNSADYKYHVCDLTWDSAPTNPPVYPGDGLWVRLVKKSGDTTLTIMGEVVSDVSQTNWIGQGLTLVSLPFSQDVKLKDTGFVQSGIKGALGFANADKIVVWNVTNKVYQEYAVLKDVGVTNWYTADINWGSPAGLADDVVIPMGCGFWVKTKVNSFNWVETNKYLNNLK